MLVASVATKTVEENEGRKQDRKNGNKALMEDLHVKVFGL